jgi:hypothetical protein
MKNRYYHLFYIQVAVLILVLAGVSACKKYNEWPVEEGHDRLFSPLGLTAGVDVLTVTLKWKNMPATNKYTIELSEDSLKFTTITKTYTGGATRDADVYSFVIPVSDLLSNKRYSARIKGLDTTLSKAESNWSAVTFKTGNEQLMQAVTAADLTPTSVTLKWTVPNTVTHFMLGAVRYDISAGEKAAGSKTISGLTVKTTYTADLYNNTVLRGTQTFKTPANLPTGPNVRILSATDDLGALLQQVNPAGTILVLLEGSSYNADNAIVLPDNASLTIWGEEGARKPVFSCNGITLPANAGSIKFENIDLTGYQNNDPAKTKRNYIFNQSVASNTRSVIFENCTIRNFANTPFRLQGSTAIVIDSLVFNNCIAYDISNNNSNGVYSFIHASASAAAKVNNIRVTNSTLYDIGYSLLLHDKSSSVSLLIENNTFNNVTGNGRIFIDYSTGFTAASFMIRNTIIGKTYSPAGTAKGIRASTIPVVLNSYKTSDVVFTAGNPIPDITDYTGASTDLFIAPATGNLKIKDNTFAGKSTAGDPRWRL